MSTGHGVETRAGVAATPIRSRSRGGMAVADPYIAYMRDCTLLTVCFPWALTMAGECPMRMIILGALGVARRRAEGVEGGGGWSGWAVAGGGWRWLTSWRS